MDSIHNTMYISIESRKGGVGKTTTALTLAQAFLDEGYQVLLFDLDLVGTTLDSTFIKQNDTVIHEVKQNEEAVNLVRLFKEIFMAGKNIPSFSSDKEYKRNTFSFAPDKCNLIGSNIYDYPKRTIPLEDPRILYDAFHAFWLLEFVKGITKSFVSAVGGGSRIAVLFDNSPGFSSIENSIHDYLTDLGPEIGKVLLVSTMDPQDLEACRQSKIILEKRLTDKVAAGDYYRSLSEGKLKEKIESPDFDSVWNSLCASGGQQPSYHSRSHVNVPSFVSILVNKVPQSIFEQLFGKGYLKESETVAPFQNHLLYYFSSPKLVAKEIAYQQSFIDSISQYEQSGKIESIEKDDSGYLMFCDEFRRLGLGDFFKKEWAPMARFRDLVRVSKGEEVVKERPKWNCFSSKGGYLTNESKVADEVDTVEQYLFSYLSTGEGFNELIPEVKDYVTSVLSDLDGRAGIDFHSDRPKLVEIGDLVSSFGLAVYRLHIYGKVCEILNRLMYYCMDNQDDLERINKDRIRNWIDDYIDGRIIDNDALKTLDAFLDDRRNARALSIALKKIMRPWEM